MAVPRIIREYFLFSRRERIAVIILFVLILLVWAAPLVFESVWTPEIPKELIMATRAASSKGGSGGDSLRHNTEWNENGEAALSAYKGSYQPGYRNVYGKPSTNRYQPSYHHSRSSYHPSGYSNTAAGKEFWFDPNTATIQDWIRLGVRERTAATIRKYVSKGGHFRQPADLERIYGLGVDDRTRLIPWVRIAGSEPPEPRRELKEHSAYSYRETNGSYPGSRRSPEPIDINTADTSSWIALPLIGSKLANRIVVFREKLGGFWSPEQIREVFGISDSVFQVIAPFLKSAAAGVRKLRVNDATEEQLKAHPYVRWELARAMIAYRQAHGPFKSADDLRKIQVLREEQLRKLLPYLAVD